MKHGVKTIHTETAYYADTDAYGVVWHGSYLRWFERGRVLFVEERGHKLSTLEKEDIVMPVIEMNLKYKRSVKLEDNVEIETELIDKARYYVTFKQVIKNQGVDCVEAIVKVAAITKDGKLYRSLPKQIEELS